jgi:hypothetical protein
MENAGSIISLLFAAAIVGFLGYRVNQERRKLREMFKVVDDANDPLVSALDSLLLSGKLQPVGLN